MTILNESSNIKSQLMTTSVPRIIKYFHFEKDFDYSGSENISNGLIEIVETSL
jgi:hypothetical protein